MPLRMWSYALLRSCLLCNVRGMHVWGDVVILDRRCVRSLVLSVSSSSDCFAFVRCCWGLGVSCASAISWIVWHAAL